MNESLSLFRMPILGPDSRQIATWFVWHVTAQHERQARSNHSQSLARLAERGGLCWQELRWVLLGLGWSADRMSEAAAARECFWYVFGTGDVA